MDSLDGVTPSSYSKGREGINQGVTVKTATDKNSYDISGWYQNGTAATSTKPVAPTFSREDVVYKTANYFKKLFPSTYDTKIALVYIFNWGEYDHITDTVRISKCAITPLSYLPEQPTAAFCAYVTLHEMRHAWQRSQGWLTKRLINNYKSKNTVTAPKLEWKTDKWVIEFISNPDNQKELKIKKEEVDISICEILLRREPIFKRLKTKRWNRYYREFEATLARYAHLYTKTPVYQEFIKPSVSWFSNRYSTATSWNWVIKSSKCKIAIPTTLQKQLL